MNFRASKADCVFSGHYTISDDKVRICVFQVLNNLLLYSCSCKLLVSSCILLCFIFINDRFYCTHASTLTPFNLSYSVLLIRIWLCIAGWSCSFVPRHASYCLKDPLKVLHRDLLNIYSDKKLKYFLLLSGWEWNTFLSNWQITLHLDENICVCACVCACVWLGKWF